MPPSKHHPRAAQDTLVENLADRFLHALLAGDGPGAEVTLRHALLSGIGAGTAYARVLQPAMEQVGALWQAGRLGVADEHLATGICKRALAAVYPLTIEDADRDGPVVVLAGVRGQMHSLGLRTISDVLDGAGFRTHYLGPDTPAEAIGEAVRRLRPQVVGLSLTLADDLPELAAAVQAVVTCDPAASILLGGSGIPEGLHDYSGYARDAESVVAVVRGLATRPPQVPEIPASPARARPPADDDRAAVEREFHATTGHLADIAREQARRARDYRAMALTDPVTGLPNRRAWDERFAATAMNTDGVLTVLILDLDGFKGLNDRDGHLAGDAVLTQVGAMTRTVLRDEDYIARLGGDEFGVLLPNTGTSAAFEIAQRVCGAVNRALDGRGVTASIGVAAYETSPRATTLAADQALYRAKAAGGDRAEIAA